jgi:hypothetical protein
MLQALCFKCFRCFIGMLQVFHMDVAKVDRDVAYVAMVVDVCCKLLLLMFHLFSRHMLQMCLFGCCIYLTRMLQVFYLDVVYVLQWLFMCFWVFLHVFKTHVSNISSSSDVCCKCCMGMFQK